MVLTSSNSFDLKTVPTQDTRFFPNEFNNTYIFEYQFLYEIILYKFDRRITIQERHKVVIE